MAIKNPQSPRSIGRQLNFTTGRMNALCQKRLEPHGLSLQQWAVLACLWRNGDLTVGALSELVGTGLPAISRIVDRMIERGLLDRRRDGADRRVTVIKLTQKGHGLRSLASFYEDVNETLFAGFTTEERELAFDLLQRMQQNAERALD